MKRFGVTHEQLASGAVRVALRGELDLAHAYTLDEELRRVERDCPSCIVIDLRELSFVTACGVSRLVAARRRARRADRRLVLVRGRAIQPLLTLTRLEQTFEVVNDVPPPLREPPPAGSVRARRGLPQCSAKHQPEATDA